MMRIRRILRPLVVGAAITVAVAPLLVAVTPAAANVEDFTYDGWDVEYELSLDPDGRAVAHVTERLTAQFPSDDQNKGIVRSLPRDYQGSSTDPRDFSVTDENGDAVPFDIESGTDETNNAPYVAVLTGDDDYVHGRQTYVIEYTLSDVVLARDDGAADEFSWDLAPSARQQPVSSFSAEIAFAPELAEHLNGNARCYAGAAGSTQECAITESDGTVTVGSIPLDAAAGVTVAIGLDAGTVVQPSQRVPNVAFDVAPIIVAAGAVGAAIAGTTAAGVMARRHRNNGRGTIVPQYEVPASLPPILASTILASTKDPIAGQMVHLAVNDVARFEEAPNAKRKKRSAQLALRLVDVDRSGDPLDRLSVSTLFSSTARGALLDLSQRNESLAKRIPQLKSSAATAGLDRGYFTKERSRVGRVLGWVALGIVAVLAVLVTLGFIFRGANAGTVLGLVGGILALAFAAPAMMQHRVHTRSGAETREYLEGVKMFITVAEAERIRMLQSYAGAERVGDGTVNVIRLYERLLPYAMLFGLEKEWGTVLEDWYRTHPDTPVAWYPFLAGHAIGNVGGAVSDVVSSISTSVSYSSSNAGGSTGGGAVGGGGGGGAAGGR
ncbi:DUF2207 domain-containing protein [Leucobacter tardus]|uniref:DUF2207 domain-containing protein n=1 Tax=Leucobacter tardus TaxID=501483 RepID=A0A939QJJ2_9MICO|nr:DUF2207 domain-containing protein [Leucobacter tardus]MBO2989914.1 DUF2207 domain-containing protein [Leucobacter tardus]